MTSQSPLKYLKLSTGQTLVILAGVTLLGGCATTSTSDVKLVSAEQTEAKAISEMVLPATTTSNAARALYMDGWADFENSRNISAFNKFAAAAEADPSFTMADVMAAWTATSTENFMAHTKKASATKAYASEGEQQLVAMLESFMGNDAEGAAKAAVKAAELNAESPRAWNFVGATYANMNKTEKARSAYKKVTKLDPTFVPGYINLGNNYLSQEPKDFAKAEKYIAKAVELTPYEPNPHDLLGDVHRAQNNLKAAYKDYTKAAELAPDLGSGLQQRGHVNSFLGNYAEARSDYAKAAKLEDARGSNAGPNFLVYKAYVHLHEGQPSSAITELQALSDSLIGSRKDGAADTRVFALQNIAQIATEIGNVDIAGKAISDAAKIQWEQAEAIGSEDLKTATKATKLYRKGMLAARMGDSEKAAAKAAAFKEAVATMTNPLKHQRYHEILGMDAFYSGDYAKAAKHLAQGNTTANMATKYYLAKSHEKAGNSADASKLFNELAVYNFNGPGYAMFRKDILKRAASS